MKDGIFVSYSHKDSEIVEKIVSVLKEKSGQEVWFDHKLRGGENYFSVIANQIISNKYFVFIVSDNSIGSDWCLRELEFAASEKRHIIAIWLDNIDVSPRIKLVIQNTHYINWYSATDDLFSQAVSMAFNQNLVGFSLQKTVRDSEEGVFADQKYFLSKEDIKKICDLLRAEENKKYSICFVPENANLLGIAYEMGISVAIDQKKALLYYKASKYTGNLDGQYLYASLKCQIDSENECYITDMLDAAENGSVLALTCMGDCYYEGKLGIPLDLNKAYDYFERAAKASGVLAMYYTAYGYRCGEVLPKDPELAYMYTLKAMEYGLPRAYRSLAFMYRDGQYVDKDSQKALELFGEAVEHGDYLSYCFQGTLYGKLGNHDKKIELYKKAVELAEMGKIKSGSPFYMLAISYDDGDGVEQDCETAIYYYFKAAERDHTNAKKWLVPCILNIDGEKRIKYLQKAYELKCKEAAYELGMIEKRKNDEKRLSSVAVKFFETGAELGDMRCTLELIYDYSWVIGNGCGDGTQRSDRMNAIQWFQFFFANADEKFLETYRDKKYNLLSVYYYAYAIELDYDPKVNKPDREFVLYNFKKSIEECPKFLGKIISFAVDGYLFPNTSDSGLTVDVIHAEDLLSLTQKYLKDYYEYIKENNQSNYADEWNKTIQILKKGYLFISKCYQKGDFVSVNKDKAKKYKLLATQLYI